MREGVRRDASGGGDPKCAVCGRNVRTGGVNSRFEAALEGVTQQSDGGASKSCSLTEREGPWGFKRIAYCGDAATPRSIQEDAGHGRKQVCVFVAVEVCDPNACLLDPVDLCLGLTGDLRLADATEQEVSDKAGEGRTKVFSIGTEEGRDFAWRRDGCAVDQNDVTADVKRWMGPCNGNGICKRRSIRHKGR